MTTTVEAGAIRSADAVIVGRRAERMLNALGLSNVEVSIALVSDATILDLNRRYRRKAKPTDVLSFPLLEIPTRDIFLAAGGKTRPLLGDIVVSVPTAIRQAKERKRRPLDELTTLVAHGLLHLLGFDHKNDELEREMDAYVRVLEAAALNKRPLAFGLRILELRS